MAVSTAPTTSARHLHLRGALQTAALRTAEYLGEMHLIVPVVAMVEGVVWAQNADRPELVRVADLAVAPEGWNGRPVVQDHPPVDAMSQSASTPGRLARWMWGTVFNAHIDGRALVCEAWLNPARAAAVGPDAVRTLARIEAGEMVEVSVGCFITSVEEDGTYHGHEYHGRWTDIVPDHLAMLSEGEIGACSVAAGCGAPRAAHLHDVSAETTRIAAAPPTPPRDEHGQFVSPGPTAPTMGSTGAALAQRALAGQGGDVTAPNHAAAQVVLGDAVQLLLQQGFRTVQDGREAGIRRVVLERDGRAETAGTRVTLRVEPRARGQSTQGTHQVHVTVDPQARAAHVARRRPRKELIMKQSLREMVASLFRPPADARTAQASDVDLRQALDAALRESVPGYLGIEVVYPTESSVIYALAPSDVVLLHQQFFTQAADETVTLNGNPVEVEQVTSYVPVSTVATAAAGGPACTCHPAAPAAPVVAAAPAAPVVAAAASPSAPAPAAAPASSTPALVGAPTMKETTRQLIAASGGRFTDADAPWIDAVPSERLASIAPPTYKPSTVAFVAASGGAFTEADLPWLDAIPDERRALLTVRTAAAAAPAPAPAAVPAPAPTADARTREEWYADAPAEVRALVDRAQAAENKHRQTLLALLKGKTEGIYSAEELAALDIPTLERTTRLLRLDVPPLPVDHSGRVVPMRAASADDEIPAAPDVHAKVRAARQLQPVGGAAAR